MQRFWWSTAPGRPNIPDKVDFWRRRCHLVHLVLHDRTQIFDRRQVWAVTRPYSLRPEAGKAGLTPLLGLGGVVRRDTVLLENSLWHVGQKFDRWCRSVLLPSFHRWRCRPLQHFLNLEVWHHSLAAGIMWNYKLISLSIISIISFCDRPQKLIMTRTIALAGRLTLLVMGTSGLSPDQARSFWWLGGWLSSNGDSSMKSTRLQWRIDQLMWAFAKSSRFCFCAAISMGCICSLSGFRGRHCRR